MRMKLCLVALLFSVALVACKNTNEKSTELFAPTTENEKELAYKEDETQAQVDIDEKNGESDEDESLQFNDIENTQEKNRAREETKDNEWKNEEDTNSSEVANDSGDDNTTQNPTPQGEVNPQGGNEQSNTQSPSVTEPTQKPVVNDTPTTKPTSAPTPTKVPEEVIRPTSTPAPTKAPSITVRPTSTPTPTKAPSVTAKPTSAPTPTKAPSDNTSSESLSVRGETIKLGDSKSSIIDKFGSPSRIDPTEYNYDFYVYKNDYSKFMMIGIANDKVVAWYTDSTDFSYKGLSTKSKVANINSTFGKSFSLKDTLSVSSGDAKITFFMDTLGDSTIDGIYVADSSVSKASTTKSVLTAWEKEVFDLTNSFRVRNGYKSLTWSDAAATSARLHSEDMAKNNYFSHNSLDGKTPFDRMKQQGISYTSAGENIIGGYGNAMFSNNGWVNSSGHRKNILSSSFNHLGVGYTLGGSYGNYATQNFFGK